MPYFPVDSIPKLPEGYSFNIVEVVKNVFISSFSDTWIEDNRQPTDWSCNELQLQPTASLSQTTGVLVSSSSSGNSSSNTDNINSGRGSSSPRYKEKNYEQFQHRLGLACIRVGNHGFVWLLNSSARISDTNLAIEEKKVLAMQSMNDFKRYCTISVWCLEIVIDAFEAVYEIVELKYTTAGAVC